MKEYACYINSTSTDGYLIKAMNPVDAALQYAANHMHIDHMDKPTVTVKVMDGQFNLYRVQLQLDQSNGRYSPV